MTEPRRRGLLALAWAFLVQFAQACSSVVCFAALARHVGPAGYSGYVTALAVVSAIQCLGLNAIREPIVQAQALSEDEKEVSFSISTLLGAALTAVSFILAAIVWKFGSNDDLALLICILGFRFFLDGLSAVPLAMNARELDFRPQSLSSVIGALVTVSVVLTLLGRGFGIVGMAIGQMSGLAIQTVLAIILTKFSLKFSWRFSLFARFWKYSVSVIWWQIIEYLNGSLDRLVASAKLPPSELGGYGFSRRLNDIVIEVLGGAIGLVTLPGFAKVRQNPDVLRLTYLRALDLAALVILPLLVLLFVFADWIVVGVFGEHWASTIPVYRVFLILGLVQTFGTVQAALIRSLGQTGAWSKYLLSQAVGNAFVVLFFAGYGAVPLAISIVVKTYSIWFFAVALVCRLLALPLLSYVLHLARPVVIALATGLLAYLCRTQFFADLGDVTIVLSSLMAIIFYCVFSFLFNRTAVNSLVSAVRLKSKLRGGDQ